MIRESFKNITDPVVVIGDGWSALACCRFLTQNSVPVVWVQGSGARILPVLPSLAHGPGVEAWKKLAESSGVELGPEQSGCFLREFRNKAFREPLWTKAPTVEARSEVLRECLWGAEASFTGPFETRFDLLPEEIENRARTWAPATSPERIEGLPIIEFKIENKQVRSVVLGSGREIACSQVIYADLWSQLPKISGLPRSLPFTRRREPVGLIQATFHHEAQFESSEAISEGFFGSLHREAGEDSDRHLFGYFLDGGKRSVWSLCVSGDEAEDNHTIAKKLRRMKSALEKMFTGMLTNVRSEQVRFTPEAVFASGTPLTSPERIAALENAAFLSDGYGPSSALAQAADLVFEPAQPQAQAETVNPTPAG
jgi:hypothetical protein